MNKRLKEIIIKLAIQITHYEYVLGIDATASKKLLNKYIAKAISESGTTTE
jgi:hypothetical protein